MAHELDKHSRGTGNRAFAWIAVTIFLSIFGAILAWSAYDDYGKTLTQEYRSLESQARLGDVQIAGALRSMNLVLQSVIDDRQAMPKLPAPVIEQRQFSILRQFPEIHYLITVDDHGHVTTAESLDDPDGLAAVRSFNAAQRDYFTIHRDAKPEDYYRYQLSRPFKTITNRYTITISRAIRGKNGQFQGVALVSLSPTYFDSVLQQVLSSDALDAAAVHNRFGDIIYRLPNPDKYMGKNIADGAAFKLYLSSNQHLTRYLGVATTDNVNRILVFSKVGDTNLDIGVSGQFDVVMAKWRNDVLMKILIFLTVAGLSLTLAWDVQRRLLARQARDKAEQRFRAYFERSMVGMATTSPKQDWIDFNPALCEMLGYSAEDLSGKTWAELTYPKDLDAEVAQFNRLLSGEINEFEMDKRFVRNNGEIVYTHLAVRAVRNPDSTIDYLVILVEDITERKRAELALLESKERFERAAETVPIALYDFVLYPDGSTAFSYISKRSKDVLGLDAETIMKDAGNFWSLIHPDDLKQVQEEDAIAHTSRKDFKSEFRITTPSGEQKWLRAEAKLSLTRSGEQPTWNGFIQDITGYKRAEDEMRTLATTDFLTGLPSRRSFITRLEDELARLHRDIEQPVALLMLDLDHFKQVNDNYGHATGDRLLKHFALLVTDELRRIDMAGRLGGEEFGIVLPGADMSAAIIFANRLRERVYNSPVPLEDMRISFTVSIGLTHLRNTDTDADVVLARADKALYRAKELGRNRAEVAEDA